MVNNLQILDYAKYCLQGDIQYIKQSGEAEINKSHKKFCLHKKSLWGDLVNPRTSICKFLDKAEVIVFSTLGATIAISSFYAVLNLSAFIEPSLRPYIYKAFEEIFDFVKIPLFTSLSFVPITLLRETIKEKLEKEEEKIDLLKKRIYKKVKNKEKILSVIDAVKSDPEMNTILNAVVNNVDLSNNGEMFNMKLIELLSQATISPNNKNFHYVAEYIRDVYENQPKYVYDDATQEFFDNPLIQDIMRRF